MLEPRQRSGKLWPIWGEKADCTDWNQLLPISCDAFENYEVKLNPGLPPPPPRLVASRRVWHMSSIYSHIPLPLCMCSESQIPLRGPFLGQRYSFSKAGASSVSLCSGHGCAASLLRWVRSGWHFTSPCRCFQKGRDTGIPRGSLSSSNTNPC